MTRRPVTRLPRQDLVIDFEALIAESICDFEKRSGRFVLGISLTRLDTSYLQVQALLLPVKKKPTIKAVSSVARHE